ncbi:DUF4056 domain-containing protein [Paraferrimonas sp. SM1919]|uniref:DUF4056 domain-containing protein n=1 Tax=Paraferrimonas sp. SM1919 TaxID=2662263 RepID=UPI001969E602|nr:DUF4056 domain-containing protein [Paraferrimonas sp. SM1919]
MFVFSLLAVTFPSFADSESVPVGIRPCCAFGTDLQAEVGPIPVPLYSIKNVVETDDVEDHSFNDGSSSVLGSLFGAEDEVNGLIYTNKGGFIDTAHVRDTADFAFYLFQRFQSAKADEAPIKLTDELRQRQIVLHDLSQIDATERLQANAELAGLLAFRLAQWHEVAQWYGLVSVGSFKEYPSAFSPEDLYSNMLGARIAVEMVMANPELSQEEYEQTFGEHFEGHLEALQAQDEDTTIAKIKELDGKWWDSESRLPGKWVLRTRDYHFSLTLMPNGMSKGNEQSIATWAKWEQFATLELNATDELGEFEVITQDLKDKQTWTHNDFQALANIAKQKDMQDSHNHNEQLSYKLDK